MSGCSNQTFWNDSYNLRQWERSFLDGQSFDLSRKYEQSQNSYANAIGFAEKLPANSLRLTDTLLRLGNASAKLNDTQSAATAYQRAIDILRHDLQTNPSGTDAGADRECLAYSLSRLGTLHERSQQFEVAKKELGEAISLYLQQGVESGDSKVDRLSKRDYATTLGAAVYTAVELNDEADAKKLYAQISAPALLTSVTPSLINSVNRKYASLLTKLGHNQEAENVLASERCRAQCKLGFDALRSNDLVSAEKSYKNALAMAGRIKNSVMLSISNAGLGDVYNLQGKLKEAQMHFEAAVVQWAITDSKPNHGMDGLLQSLALVSVFEPLEKSEPRLKRWINLRQEIYGAKDERTAQAILLAALVCDHQYQKNKALEYGNQAFDIAMKAAAKERIDASGIESLGDFFYCSGQYVKAGQLYRHLLDRSKFYGRARGFNDVELLLRIAASEKSADPKNSNANAAVEAEAMLIAKSIRPPGVYLVAKSLAYLSHDLAEHSQLLGAGQVVGYVRVLIARVQPSGLRDRRCLAVARAAIESYDKHTDAHLSRIVLRAEPGSFEASAAIDAN
ncbi:hypothetical protein BH10CYA1_BH10CYA1_46850 [soil metagenome]